MEINNNSAEREMIRTNLQRFGERQITPQLDALNRYPDGSLPKGLLSGLRDMGLFDLLLAPEEVEGSNLRMLTTALHTLAEAAAAPALILFAHSFAQQLLTAVSAKKTRSIDKQRSRSKATPLLAYPVYTELAAIDGGMTCCEDHGTFLLDGTCKLVVNAPIADRLVLPVTLFGNEGGPALIVLERDTAGIAIGEPLVTLGMRGCPVADVTANRAHVDKTQLVASPPDASVQIRFASGLFFGPAAAVSAGILECSIRVATDYARERYQGGCNIIEHQQLRSILSDMVADYAICRQAVKQLTGRTPRKDVAMDSLFIRAKEGAARATCDGVQILGGYGYMEDYSQERCMRDARQAQCLLGRCDMQRQELMADWLDGGANLPQE